MIMAILGFVAPFIPDLFGMLKSGQDHRHEMQMLELRGKQAEKEFTWRIAEIDARADIEEMKAVRKPHKSFGVQLLDKAADAQGLMWRWSFNVIFILFAILDWLISSVRPTITYWIFGLYASIKMAVLWRLFEITEGVTAALLHERAWTATDQEMLVLVLAFWFGQRVRARAIKGV